MNLVVFEMIAGDSVAVLMILFQSSMNEIKYYVTWKILFCLPEMIATDISAVVTSMQMILFQSSMNELSCRMVWEIHHTFWLRVLELE